MRRMAFLLPLFVAACSPVAGEPELASSQQFTLMPADWTCQTYSWYLGRNLGDSTFVIAPPANGVYVPIDVAGDSITLTAGDNFVWYWTSTALIRGIMVRADVPGTTLGDATNQLWLYASPTGGGAYSGVVYTDTGGVRYEAKYIELCFDEPPPQPGLQISKTADPQYIATFEWTIQKRADVTDLTMSTGQVFPVNYVVDVTRSGATASDFAGFGQITIHNPATVDATITGVTDEMEGGLPVTTDCHVTFPYTLAPGADLVCDWTAALPDPATRVDTATVTTSGPVAGGSATATLSFVGAPPAEVVDTCVSVVDSVRGMLGQACDSMSFSYLTDVGPYDTCGGYSFTNTATFTANDSGETGSASVTIPVTVPCDVGCTLTPGYWKTHSTYGPARYDDTWALVGEDTAFFLSGKTWYSQFWTNPAGNAYWILSHLYAAAALNLLNGAAGGAVQGTMDASLALLQTYTPAQVQASRPVRDQFVANASILDAYNNGLTGPGHCDQ